MLSTFSYNIARNTLVITCSNAMHVTLEMLLWRIMMGEIMSEEARRIIWGFRGAVVRALASHLLGCGFDSQ